MSDRQVDNGWQVRGPPLDSSLQDVKPATVEQSAVTAQITEKGLIIKKVDSYSCYHIGRYSPHHRMFLQNR